MRKYLIFFSFFFTLCLVSAPFPVPQKPDESLAREASAAALRGVYYLVSQQDGKGNFSSDPGLDRRLPHWRNLFPPENRICKLR